MSNWLLFVEKSARQQLRDRIGTALTLFTTPTFAGLYGFLGRGDPAHDRAFDAFVPGLLVLSVIMIVFSSAMALAREVESGAMRRVRTWPVSAAAVLGGSATVQLVLALVANTLTLLTARAMGATVGGSTGVVLALCALAAVSSVGLGLCVAGLSHTQGRAFLVASLVMFLLLLFSGVIFPRPSLHWMVLRGVEVGPFDLLPTTHLHAALGRVLGTTSGESLLSRTGALSALSALYFAGGVAIFRLRHGVGIAR
jgi:ABC-2 type transport system permease protein